MTPQLIIFISLTNCLIRKGLDRLTRLLKGSMNIFPYFITKNAYCLGKWDRKRIWREFRKGLFLFLKKPSNQLNWFDGFFSKWRIGARTLTAARVKSRAPYRVRMFNKNEMDCESAVYFILRKIVEK